MVTKEVLQRFIDLHASEIGEILPGGLKNKEGRWLLVCPVMERFDLDFSKVEALKEPEEVVDEVVEEPATTDEPEHEEEVVEEVVEEPAPKKSKKSKKK